MWEMVIDAIVISKGCWRIAAISSSNRRYVIISSPKISYSVNDFLEERGWKKKRLDGWSIDTTHAPVPQRNEPYLVLGLNGMIQILGIIHTIRIGCRG
jgi:hypothetical protein